MHELPIALLAAAGLDPAPVAHGDGAGSDLLLVLSAALGMVAMIAATSAFAARRTARRAIREARHRSDTMAEFLNIVRMAERMAGLGLWQYDPATGEQCWSAGMRALFGVDHDEPFVAGDAETLLLAHDIDLVAGISHQRAARDPFELHYEIVGLDGTARSFSVQACNLRDAEGAVTRVLAVVRDITGQVARERELAQSQALALAQARQARALAATDPLTGLANRRQVMAELDRMLIRARGTGRPLALIVFDLDHFKVVNDTFGHLLGDKVLRQIGVIARNQARETDLVGRVGGEEFVWIMPDADAATAHQLAERLRRSIARRSAVEDLPGVTASVGCAQMQPGDTSLAFFARADAALYAAKHGGRNQVRLAA